MSKHNIHRNRKETALNDIHLSYDMALRLALNGWNYLCLEHIYVVPKMIELLRFACIS